VLPDLDHAAERLRHVARLSPTETVVARFMLEGLRDAEIAQKLGRAERTAKRHVSQVLAKAGVKNRASLWSALGQDCQHRHEDDDDEPEDDDDEGEPEDGDDDGEGEDDDDEPEDDEGEPAPRARQTGVNGRPRPLPP
jgi:DNA-binding CsgD family transcriptional regulator